jgi:hypothetical protein
MEINGSYPVVAVWFILKFEPADIAPGLEVIICIAVVLAGNNLSQFTEQQRKSSFYGDYTNSHIVLVKHKHVARKS